MSVTALLISFPVALVGAYYLVNAGTVGALHVLEGERASQVRVRLRRVNGGVMIALGVVLYVAVSRTFPIRPRGQAGLVAPLAWLATMPLLAMMLVLALLDMRLTRRLKRDLLRKAAMKSKAEFDHSGTTGSARASARGAALAVVAVLTAGQAMACDDASRQSQASSAPTTGAATRPATGAASPKRTPMREADVRERGEEEPQKLRTIELKLGEELFVLQVADEPQEREAGLMFRPSLAEDEGMIFVFPEPRYLAFWMKNTWVPLDILYVDAQGRVLNIEQMAARDLRTKDSAGPAKWAIELPLNTAKRLGLKAGMQLEIPENARVSQE